jgi:hypothetical protein
VYGPKAGWARSIGVVTGLNVGVGEGGARSTRLKDLGARWLCIVIAVARRDPYAETVAVDPKPITAA